MFEVKETLRHGDINFSRVDEKIKGNQQDHIVVAEGETVGHLHKVTGSVIVSEPTNNDIALFEVTGDAVIDHPEHGKVKLLPGVYRPAFGGYATGSLKDGKAIMVLNVDAVMSASKSENIEQKEIIVQSLMHEFGHALQEYLDMEYDEGLVERATDSYKQTTTKEREHMIEIEIIDD